LTEQKSEVKDTYDQVVFSKDYKAGNTKPLKESDPKVKS
jgi:hypothetical protein